MDIRDTHSFIITELNDWKDIFKLNNRFLRKFVYRGQANENWILSTSLERQIDKLFPSLVDKITYPSHEMAMIKEFQWKYPLYSNNGPDLKNYVEWLTIMQHFGSTTRLLDFTYSFYVALYMAVYDNGENSAIWAINKIPLEFNIFDKYKKQFKVNSVGNDTLNRFSIDLANDIISNHSFNSSFEKYLIVLNPQICNERLSRQQGLFIMPSNIQCPFQDCLQSYNKSLDPVNVDFNDLTSYSHDAKNFQQDILLIKIVIPNKLNYGIIRHLRSMNVTTEILFPGLEGLAKSLNYARFTFGSFYE